MDNKYKLMNQPEHYANEVNIPSCSHSAWWKNCLPRNGSLVPKRLGTTALEHRRRTVLEGLDRKTFGGIIRESLGESLRVKAMIIDEASKE